MRDFKLERYFAKYEFTAPYLFCSSDCETIRIKELLEMEKGSLERFRSLRLGYTESQGNLELRKEIAKLYRKVSPYEVLVFSGAEESIFIFMNTLLKKGDHAIVQFPTYQSLLDVAESIGCNVTKWVMDEKNNWELDLEFLKRNLRKNTRLIVVNMPNNPTGYLMPKGKFLELAEIARKRNIYLFSDEVYKYLEYSASDGLPSACDLYRKGVSVGVLSKSFGLAGLRIGWIATKDRKLLRKMQSFKDYTTICNSAPSEFLAAIALRNRKKLVKRNLKIIENNLKLLDKFFKKHSKTFEWIRPNAGPIALVKLKTKVGSEKFCKEVVERTGVLLMPSSKFDFGDRHFRIGFGRKNMRLALKKLNQFIGKKII